MPSLFQHLKVILELIQHTFANP